MTKGTILTVLFALFFNCCAFAQLTAQEKEELDYIVSLQSDTSYGTLSIFPGFGKMITKFTPKGGVEQKIKFEELKAYRRNEEEFEAYSDKDNAGFFKIALRNSPYKLCAVDKGQGYSSASFENAPQSAHFYEYSIYENNTFITTIDKKNYEELIPKYFGGCETVAKTLKLGYTKYKDMRQLLLHYDEGPKCK